MKKDVDKLLSRTLFTYGIVLLFIFVLKIFGLNYFDLDMKNRVIKVINDFILYWRLENLWYGITLYINALVIMGITCNDNSKKMKWYVLCCMPIIVAFQYLKNDLNLSTICVFIDLLYLLILSLIYNIVIKRDKIHKYTIANYFIFTIMSILFQAISLIARNCNVHISNNFIHNIIISLDYVVLCIFIYKLYFIKGGNSLCQMVHSSSLDLLISLKNLPRKLLVSYQERKPKTTTDKLTNRIYLTLFWLYNFFTVAVVLFIATLNDTFIECIFILSSFWINKGVFGKPFHLKKASTCFIVSSLSYYILNRLTWKVGISFLIPVVLGISLSYITSLFMARRENLYLHKGMSKESFYKLITQVTTNEEHIEICKRYYVDKESNLKIALHFNYSEINIKKIKQKINKDIKELYK